MKKRKAFAIIIAIVMVITVLAGCDCSEEDRESKDIVEEEETYGSFIVLSKELLVGEGWLEQYIMYDPQTKIMWTFIEGDDSGGLSIIYNVDGTPVLYEE